MILPIQHTVRAAWPTPSARLYDIPADDPVLAAIPVEIPPRRALGDLAVPLAFELARRLRKAPRAIAQEIAARLGPIDGIARIEAAPNGYVNFFLDRPAQFARWLTPAAGSRPRRGAPRARRSSSTPRSIPNKAAHIGHLRNAALGDAFGRLLRFLGRTVEIQNYIDDTGVQVADVAVGFRELEHKALDEVRADRRHHAVRLLLLGPLRARHRVVRGGQDAAEDPRRGAARHRARRQPDRRPRRLHRRPDRPLPPRDDAADEHRLRPADVGRRHPAAALLDARLRVPEEDRRGLPADRRPAEGLLGHADRRRRGRRQRRRADAARRPRPTTPTAIRETAIEPREKVIVRSDGTVTYVGKDMAYQLWKFGLLGKDFHYRVFAERDGEAAAVVDDVDCRQPRAASHPPFGARVVGLQRHRHAAVVPAEAAQAGARGARLRGAGGALGPLLVRDGGAVARHRARARLRDRRRRRPAVRRGLGTQGTRASRPTTCSIG